MRRWSIEPQPWEQAVMDGGLALLRDDVFEDFETIRPMELPRAACELNARLAGPGILFVEDFDQKPAPPESPPPAEPEIIAPVFTEADIEAAHEAGRAAGLAAALADHSAVQPELSAAALAAIGEALAVARTDAEAVAHRMAEDLAAAILALLQAALPATAEARAGDEVGALLQALLPPLSREADVKIRVHPDLIGGVTEALHDIARQHGGQIDLAGDTDLAKAEVTVTWQGGEARRDLAALWAELRATLAPYALPPLDTLLNEAGHGQ